MGYMRKCCWGEQRNGRENWKGYTRTRKKKLPKNLPSIIVTVLKKKVVYIG